jgi:hypothetical protein
MRTAPTWLVVLLALALPAAAQRRPQKPPARAGTPVAEADSAETEVELPTLAAEGGLYDTKRVRTRGVLELLGVASDPGKTYYVLRSRHDNSEVLFVPGTGLHSDDLKPLLGKELSIGGVVRLLRAAGEAEAPSAGPALPPLPAASPELPRVSITVLLLSAPAAPARDTSGQNFAKQVLANPGQFAGKTVSILGQFRGNNLFGDLPTVTRRKPADWVLKDGEVALWITEKPPKGSGFALDPDYKGDTERWVEVEGKPEVVDGVLYLRASKVTLARRKPQQ